MFQGRGEDHRPASTTRLRRILVVDGLQAERHQLVQHLGRDHAGAVDGVGSAGGALALVGRHTYAAAILAIELPDMDGRKLVQILRRSKFRAPIILLSAAYAEADVVQGLDAGANDYVAKPYRPGVLLARLRAHLRLFERTGDAVLAIGPYLFDPARKRLIATGGRQLALAEFRLTGMEIRLLKYLYQQNGRVVDRTELMRNVWCYRTDLDSHTVETHVYRLRRKIEPDPAQPRIILSEQKGYRLCADWPADPAARDQTQSCLGPATLGLPPSEAA